MGVTHEGAVLLGPTGSGTASDVSATVNSSAIAFLQYAHLFLRAALSLLIGVEQL
jgi:hypothetical protein